MHHFIAISEFKLKLQSGNAKFGSKSTIFLAVWPRNLTDDHENNRAPLLSNIKLYVSVHHHMWIQTGATVRQRLKWFMTSVTLTFDLWPWPFAWTSLLALVITPENFLMIRWWEHSQNGVTDRQTDRQTDWTIHRAAWSQLKISLWLPTLMLLWCSVVYRPTMMTSANINIFRVTGPLCGEFTSHRWIPLKRPVTRSFDVFFDLRLIKRLSKQSYRA